MFDSFCTECRKRQLIFPSQITGFANTAEGPVVGYTCWCGADQTWAAHGAGRHLVAA